jgi:arylsulfatase A-like enzyme
VLAGVLLCLGSAALAAEPAPELTRRPNVVFILADDLGYTDIESFGSEIRTPTISALAGQGVSFTNYHTAASCAPARAMLMTGVNNHRAGVPNIPEMIPPEQGRHEHYQGTLSLNTVTVARLLRDAGYHTYMAGKWHLGKTPDLLPGSRGFERTVAMADSGADNWEKKTYLPLFDKANWFADGEEIELPEDFYSSRYLVDRMIEFIDSNRNDGKPFFAYLPFLAVHMPVQAPQEFTDRYMGAYDGGWDELRRRRHENAVELGIVPAGTDRVRMHTTGDWDALSDDRKRYEAKRMAVYAGMVEAMDFHIGRLVQYLKDSGQYENTVFIFTSDNGSEASGNANPHGLAPRLSMRLLDYNNDYETLGLKGSFNTISPSFASASASPLAYYKFYVGEGGMRVPLIIAGESLPFKQQHSNAFSYATDIVPTILELTGVSTPGGVYSGRRIEPVTGHSLVPLLDGSADGVYSQDETIGYELAGSAVLFQGDYKIVLNRNAAGDHQWHLFDIVADPGETRDLGGEMPARLQRMLSLYDRYTRENGVLPPPPGYDPRRQAVINGLRNRFGAGAVLFVLALFAAPLVFIVYRLRRRRRLR